jgi:metal-responsive CopG/Arc/MetJ family transcriptional regulator
MRCTSVEILSISMDKGSLKRLNEVQKRLGFKSRSKMLRSAVLSLLKSHSELEALKGSVESVFVVTYTEGEKNNVSDLLHRFGKTVKTSMHHHESGIGVDILNISASAQKTRDLYNSLERNRCVRSVSCVVVKEAG